MPADYVSQIRQEEVVAGTEEGAGVGAGTKRVAVPVCLTSVARLARN